MIFFPLAKISEALIDSYALTISYKVQGMGPQPLGHSERGTLYPPLPISSMLALPLNHHLHNCLHHPPQCWHYTWTSSSSPLLFPHSIPSPYICRKIVCMKLVPDAKKVEGHSSREQKERMETEGLCSLQILLCMPNPTWVMVPAGAHGEELTWGYETLMGSGLKQQGREADFSVKAIPGPLASTSASPFCCPHPHCSLQTLCKPYVVLKASNLIWK